MEKEQAKFYFAGSIRGGRDDVELYRELIKYLQAFGRVLTEHIGLDSLSSGIFDLKALFSTTHVSVRLANQLVFAQAFACGLNGIDHGKKCLKYVKFSGKIWPF